MFWTKQEPPKVEQVVEIFTLRVNYKSGKTETFDVTKFEVKNGNWSWSTHSSSKIRPIVIGVDHIESVWQVGVRNG